MVRNSQCFCIRNAFNAPTQLIVAQLDGYGGTLYERFSADINYGQASCCHYSNSQCNKATTPDAVINFEMYVVVDSNRRTGYGNIHIPAGGYAMVSGDPDHPTIQSYDPHNQPFQG
ncbi:uncharacterized protein BX664DRAFT_315750 [Halteromyces radiatus]|uniref:uncharacterized protein n=1 Tax=Halteromyces radiatus TaxID=101107 RepID=UPI002220C0D5|nr:uncharacterized protein BX664DRAFT_315750 [Halteromyces radiatus]KAI8086561.1 hypothetical protein BX664DRAFT_315750 [Halteromyces radiatus]